VRRGARRAQQTEDEGGRVRHGDGLRGVEGVSGGLRWPEAPHTVLRASRAHQLTHYSCSS
jgi:hypothetical protein